MISLDFDSKPERVRVTRSEDPPLTRLTVDQASNGTGQTSWKNLNPALRDITVDNDSGGLKVNVELREASAMQTRINGNTIEVVPAEAETDATALPDVSNDDNAGLVFERGDSGEGKLRIMLPDPNVHVSVQEEGADIRVELDGDVLPEVWQKHYDVADYGTTVSAIDARRVSSSRGVIAIHPVKGKRLEFVTYQDGLELVVEARPKEPLQRKVATYDGERISLTLQNVDVRRVLQLIAESQNKNVLISDGVQGEISVNFQKVRWDEALDMVLRSRKLSKREQGDIWLIGPAAELADYERQDLEQKKQLEDLAPLEIDYIQINYAKASDLVKVLETEGTDTNKSRFLSARGSVTADPRTNILLVQETSDRLNKIREIVAKLDRPVRQVQIEARVVIAKDGFSKQLGVAWGGTSTKTSGSNSLILGGSTDTIVQRANQLAGNDDDVEFPGALAVDMGLDDVDSATSLALGFYNGSNLLSLELSAYQSDSKIEIVSQPKLITTDGKKALIESGTEIPYQTVQNDEVSIEFKKAVLSMAVTPQITPDNRLIMDLDISKDSKGETLSDGNFAIDTNHLQTQVLVNNGETLVLGGVFEVNTENSVIKTPFFGDIPYIGRLFRKTVNSEDKAELLIFITPKLVSDVNIP
ncbi:type IV pilus secretin PilQ [Pokkaliibacter sp. MBI-7]|uniref:type IV pilus secretin PilQ n=1 Tax=Pokkaliibacter sp. MBI-7 TaxID=3040600 RepID=UPI00244787DE|nr:type IV pilus secretin PilQ [Pokkaliibacter sp. MBI-7]MDH2433614.1 type IV pilus secretin PilQ [Pokkaliibacter sp. MBI-7]